MMTDENNHSFHTELHGVTAQWQFTDFLNLKLGNGEFLDSPIFQETSEASWKISLYPEGRNKDDSGYISLYLYLTSTNQFPVSATWSMSIKIRDKIIETRQFTHKFVKFCGWGNPTFLERYQLMESTSACKSLTIECTVRLLNNSSDIAANLVLYECPCQRSNNCVKNLTSNFGELLLNKEHCDLKIKVGRKCYDVHKSVLSARSTVFSAMFKHDVAENLNSCNCIDIPDCDTESFEVFLEFLYTGKVDKVVYSNSISVYRIADKYGGKDLQEKCCIRLSEGLEVNLIYDILELATTHEETELLERATEFFLENTKLIFGTEKWFNFFNKQPSLADELLKELSERSTITPKVKA